MTIGRRRTLSRQAASREPYKKIHMVFEGTITEPIYIEEFIRSVSKKQAMPGNMIKGAGVPLTIIERCIEIQENIKSSRKNSEYSSADEVWAIFDVDEHDLDQALQLAKKHNIKCVISNPCFEVWGHLHTSQFDRPGSRHDVQDSLKHVVPGYHHDKNPRFDWSWCKPKIENAVRNAVCGRRARAEEGSKFPKDAPVTNFDRLLGMFDSQLEALTPNSTWSEWQK